jgi:hypothetical protein
MMLDRFGLAFVAEYLNTSSASQDGLANITTNMA